MRDNETLRKLLSPDHCKPTLKVKKKTHTRLSERAKQQRKERLKAFKQKRRKQWVNIVRSQKALHPVHDSNEKEKKDEMLFHALRGGGFETNRRRH